MVEVRRCSFSELESAPTFADLLAEYAEESRMEGMPPPLAKIATYRKLDNIGLMNTFGAFAEGDLVGFIAVLVAPNPHYSVDVATSESFFVAKEHRKTGAGLRLLHAAEQFTDETAASGLLISAPSGGDLARVLDGLDSYVETNRVFFRRRKHV